MNIFDIVSVIFLAIAIFGGWRSGFAEQVLSLMGIVGGVVIAASYGKSVGAWLGIDEAYSAAIGVVITFIAVAIAAAILSKLLSKFFSAIGLGSVNTILGILLATAKYALVLSVIFVAFEKFNNKAQIVDARHFKESKSFKPVAALSSTAMEWFDAFTKEVGK